MSVDRRRALVKLEKQPEHWIDPMYRWVDIETQRVLEEWREPALSGMPLETMRDGGGVIREPDVGGDSLEADIVQHATALLEAGAPFEPRFGVSRDASILNLGDWLYVAETRTGKVGDRLTKDASYYPHVADDGSFFVYSRMTGMLDGGYLGNYMPFVAPLPAGAPSRKLNVRDIDGWKMALSRDGAYLYVTSGNELPDGGCFVRATIAAPSPVKKLLCVEKDERIRDLVFSPSRHLAVVTVGHSDVENRATRAVWIELPDGKVVGELRHDTIFDVATVDDAGVGLAGGVPTMQAMARVDAVKRRIVTYETDVWVPYSFYGAAWIDADRWVFGEGGGTRTIDLSALPKTTVPWPSGP
ncbi:MAG TPA: hypothetical protein VM261_24280 [Kofleriaceae bacterium]|nr:hypothetical protein [Kofleriaceae bacterium]